MQPRPRVSTSVGFGVASACFFPGYTNCEGPFSADLKLIMLVGQDREGSGYGQVGSE